MTAVSTDETRCDQGWNNAHSAPYRTPYDSLGRSLDFAGLPKFFDSVKLSSKRRAPVDASHVMASAVCAIVHELS